MAHPTTFLACLWMACATICLVSAVSFKNKDKYYAFEVSSRAQGKVYNGKEFREKVCEDMLKGCQNYERFCSKHELIRKKCPRTCGLCHTFAPIHCSETVFGCCWDNQTVADGLNMKGCPVCVDINDVDCRSLVHLCPVDNRVRKLCPQTCGVPCEKCADGPYESEELCRLYKDLNFCEISPKIMRKACKKTCGFCYYQRLDTNVTPSCIKEGWNASCAVQSSRGSDNNTRTRQPQRRRNALPTVSRRRQTKNTMIAMTTMYLVALVLCSTSALEIVEEDSLDTIYPVDTTADVGDSICRDIYSQATCSKYSSVCKVLATMQQKCQRTCGICKIKPPVCVDRMVESSCRKYETLCDRSNYIQKNCKKTCGYCAAVAELPCQSTKYGCCWDNMTRATGPNGKDCPACKDVVRPACAKLASDCNFASVRRHCPVTCQLSCATCADNPSQASFCPFFKKAGFCRSEETMMRKYCAKTCDLC